MLRIAVLAGLALALAACGDEHASRGGVGAAGEAAVMPAAPPAPPETTLEFAKSLTGANGREAYGDAPSRAIIQPDQGGGGGAPKAPLIAYTYDWTFLVPADHMQGLLSAQKKACEDAGPAKCYVTNSQISSIGQEGSSGQLTMRATEEWVRAFEGGMDGQIKPFGASVDTVQRGSEDLTTEIVDNEARLKSMIAYRDGLQAMLKSKPGKLSDLLDIQRTLAEAQGDLDSRESTLAALKLRVAMSDVTFNYTAQAGPGAKSVWRPLGDAFAGFMPGVAETLGAIVRGISVILPTIVMIALGLWLVVLLFRLWRWNSRRKAAKAQKSPPVAVSP